MKLSIGVVSYNRPACLEALIRSLSNVDISCAHEICVLDNGSPDPATREVLSLLAETGRPYQTCLLSHNVGFAGGWNILENVMQGEYRLMMQDDTWFIPRAERVDLSAVLAMMADSGAVYMSIGDCAETGLPTPRAGEHYSDGPHVEHRSLRQELGDYRGFPRYYPTLALEGCQFEPELDRRLARAGVKFYSYPKFVATHQRKGHSWLQTLLHETPPGLPADEVTRLWQAPTMEAFQRLGMRVWD